MVAGGAGKSTTLGIISVSCRATCYWHSDYVTPIARTMKEALVYD